MCTMCGTAGCQLRNTSIHVPAPCLRHIDVVFIGQLILFNSFSNLALLQLFYKYTCIVVSIYLMDHGRQLRNSPLRLDCCTQGTVRAVEREARQSYAMPSVHKVKGRRDVTFSF